MKIDTFQLAQYRNGIYARTYAPNDQKEISYEEAAQGQGEQSPNRPAEEFLNFSTSRTLSQGEIEGPLNLRANGGYRTVNPFTGLSLETPQRHIWHYNPDEDRYPADQMRYETLTYSFASEGRVKTEDGRLIEFFYNMSLTKESYLMNQPHAKVNEIDYNRSPLVINFDGNAPRFSQATTWFDLDGDGNQEKMALLEKGSGFLSLDLNNDGIINDGSELFGATSGDSGFKELLKYDSDGNFWIDENDAIFDKLTILEIDENGERRLTSLKDAGLGAIYLYDEPNDFALWDASSVALNEDGSVCSVHAMNMDAGGSTAPFIDQLLPGSTCDGQRNDADPEKAAQDDGHQKPKGILNIFYEKCISGRTETKLEFTTAELKDNLFDAVEYQITESVKAYMGQRLEISFDRDRILNAIDELWGTTA